jgi:hypothetical protein
MSCLVIGAGLGVVAFLDEGGYQFLALIDLNLNLPSARA